MMNMSVHISGKEHITLNNNPLVIDMLLYKEKFDQHFTE